MKSLLSFLLIAWYSDLRRNVPSNIASKVNAGIRGFAHADPKVAELVEKAEQRKPGSTPEASSDSTWLRPGGADRICNTFLAEKTVNSTSGSGGANRLTKIDTLRCVVHDVGTRRTAQGAAVKTA